MQLMHKPLCVGPLLSNQQLDTTQELKRTSLTWGNSLVALLLLCSC